MTGTHSEQGDWIHDPRTLRFTNSLLDLAEWLILVVYLEMLINFLVP